MNIQLLPNVALAAFVPTGMVSAATMSQELLSDRLPGFAAFGESHGLPGAIPLVAMIVFASLVAVVARLAGKRPGGLTASIPLPRVDYTALVCSRTPPHPRGTDPQA